MSLIIVDPKHISTVYDGDTLEIESYMKSLDFSVSELKKTNELKRAVLFLLNQEEDQIFTLDLDYKKNKIEIKNNEEYLISAKICGKKGVLIKVLSNEHN